MKKICFLFLVMIVGLLSFSSDVYCWCNSPEDYVAEESALILEDMTNFLGSEQSLFPDSCNCNSPECDPCWNYDNQGGRSFSTSTTFLQGQLVSEGVDVDLVVPSCDFGDVRFRCRYQKDEVYCFAFRC